MPEDFPTGNNPYHYHKLSDESEIRLVTIKPGRWTDPIICELSCYSLDVDDVTEYFTLSYAWGSPKATDTITLEGRPWPVTVNLANALLFIRDPDKPVKMWIDALCIDQSDLQERGGQVQLMKEIYSCGTKVIVYLGDGMHHRPKRLAERRSDAEGPVRVDFHGDERDESHLESFWDALSASITPSFPADSGSTHRGQLRPRPISSTFHMFCLLRILGNKVLTSALVDKMRKLTDPSFDPLDTLIENLRGILLNPWWQRIWVVQEMIVSRVAVVRCGPVQCPWEMFISAASAISCPSFQMSALFRPDSAKVLQYFCRQVLSFRDLRNEWQQSLGAPILTLLQDFSARRATDERDKVFALLGLSLLAQRFLIRVSYEDTVAEVYRSTAVGIIRRSRSLDIWCGDLARKNRRDLDSWVPDWSAVYDEADRRRARTAYNEKGECRSEWKLTVVKSEGEYWKYVAEGMELLYHWLQQDPVSRKLPSRLRRLMLGYRTELNNCLAFYYAIYHNDALVRTVKRIQQLCRKLETYCTSTIIYPEPSGDPSVCAFCRSAAFYREIKAHRPVDYLDRAGDLPFGEKSEDWLSRLQITARGAAGTEAAAIDEEIAFPRPYRSYPRRSFLSLESVARGFVAHLGSRLFSWEDRHAAFNTVFKWASYYLDLAGTQKLNFAKTLMGGASLPGVGQGMPAVDRVGDIEQRIRDMMLVEWLDQLLRKGDFQDNARMRPYNDALVVATGGRVMFALADGTLGLGPGSMVVGDEVHLMPGGSSHIVLRSLVPEPGEYLEGPAYTVIGDCYLDPSSSIDQKPWPGWLPEEMFRTMEDMLNLKKRRRIFLF
ncbi:heterokaryon incompatibility protein-domain-containing protein [Apiosordaria backusii]|uniref:Heterokaryon incompatibility protein-domain-containing protein n=1 Tax=Apiosordaria backusii TaxID=314023 RepID=A0AA40K3T6_9PEZI|nr:heterokaryon incompatibility protein-domain-containing protein [Apiosordaria backusii]